MARPREFDPQAVLDAAMEVFWEQGYEATSTEDLCRRTGLGRGSLYNAFGSKHRLYEEALRRYAETRADAQLRMLARPGPVRERLRELMLGVIDADMADPRRHGCLALNAATESAGRDGEVPGLVRRHFTDLEQALCHLVTLGQAAGELPAGRPPIQVARTFQSAYYGLRVLAKVTDDRNALLDVVEGALAAL
ncbi:TetR family transcriptional regulator [Microtetraspora sp. NBRC 13810]|uniref:TetR/AcrR family transcriptional regulator n=1 Tax=Microtetraspora sp. NBRC 13810 TaxID=3030990 RepID=UPI0024A36073|nr:TetR/AcrR family transcriptional regulator [Microtetraspora sp. NBRC 13810]GLW12304.1 TetR family transcriptional regulator [Microtetraspora sp. NBRC 13810]